MCNRIAICALMSIVFVLFSPHDASAQFYGGSWLDPWDEETGHIGGFSFTERAVWYEDFYQCIWEEYDWYYEKWYCAEVQFYSFWVALLALYQPPTGDPIVIGNVVYASYYIAKSWSSYIPSNADTIGWWEHFGVHWFGREDWYQSCTGAYTCGNWTYWDSISVFMGVTSMQRAIPPVIYPSGNTIWYFGGETPPGYPMSVTINSSGGASTQWVATPSGKVNLSTTSGAQTVVTSTSDVAFLPGDVQIKAVVNGIDSFPAFLTRRLPMQATLIPGQSMHSCPPGGWEDTLTYAIQDNFFDPLPAPIGVNESWTTQVVDVVSNNWTQPVPNGLIQPASAFTDTISVIGPGNPTPVCSGTPTGTLVKYWGQAFRVGSPTSGIGKRIQTDTLEYYTDHGKHNSVVSPAP